MRSSADTVGFGIIGCGVVAPTHAVALDAIENVRLLAAADSMAPRAENFCKEFSVPKACRDYRELLDNPDIQAVCVCTPHHAHASVAIEAARAGKHVLVEKPMATTLADADAVIRACEEANVRLGVVFQHRFDPASRYVKQLLQEGVLGKPVLGGVHVLWFRTSDYYDSQSWRGRWETAGGGVLINQAIHAVDILCWLMGPVVRVAGYCNACVHPIEVEDTAAAALYFENGALGVIQASTTTYPQTPERVELAGSQGTITIEGGQITRHELAGQRADAPQLSAEDPRFRGKSYYGASHPRLLEDFVEAIREDRPPLVDGREGRKALEVVSAVYESSRTGRPVVLPGSSQEQ
jgi:predicted dehydrogenase